MQPTAKEWLARMGRGEISAVELAEHYLARVGAVNPRLNAVVALDADAVRAAARDADERRSRGEDGPLLGLPVTIKDCLDVAGLPCRAGSRARKDVPRADAVVVERIKRAGGVILGKTNLPELGSSYETDNKVYGRTNHPLDAARTPGGSSGGEAAVIGADASPLGVGTDGGGSVRVPSHYCGLVGLRPTTGRVPATGSWPDKRSGPTLDITCVGPMGRSTADIALLLDVIHGPDLADPFAHPVPLRDWSAVDVAGLRVGWYVEDGLAHPSDATVAAVRRAAGILEKAGAAVVRVEPPAVTEATELFFSALAADGGDGVRALVGDAPDDHTEQFLDLLDNPRHGSSTSAGDYFALLDRMFGLRSRVRRWIDGYDVVLAPVAAGPAPRHGEPPQGVAAADYGRYEGFNYTHTYSVAGLPSASVPAGVEGGLPIGVQVIAQCWREDLVLAACAAIERETGGFQIVDRPALS
ncbi:amidase [Actinomadura decatromicini]|uniref:Amidase n=1 Tax=Actinomadura decatromicini TaxID=2604572 RepID=A0A5D3FFU0_9ACTN|nr:amidase [Actinomadura decatromicini]TYK46959.1 amidase [Actinomadura decatromicini]